VLPLLLLLLQVLLMTMLLMYTVAVLLRMLAGRACGMWAMLLLCCCGICSLCLGQEVIQQIMHSQPCTTC
jgi:membrane protein required for beta-lactamase induction